MVESTAKGEVYCASRGSSKVKILRELAVMKGLFTNSCNNRWLRTQTKILSGSVGGGEAPVGMVNDDLQAGGIFEY